MKNLNNKTNKNYSDINKKSNKKFYLILGISVLVLIIFLSFVSYYSYSKFNNEETNNSDDMNYDDDLEEVNEEVFNKQDELIDKLYNAKNKGLIDYEELTEIANNDIREINNMQELIEFEEYLDNYFSELESQLEDEEGPYGEEVDLNGNYSDEELLNESES